MKYKDIPEEVINNAVASVEMEGFTITERHKDIALKLATGKLSYEQFLADCKSGKFDLYMRENV